MIKIYNSGCYNSCNEDDFETFKNRGWSIVIEKEIEKEVEKPKKTRKKKTEE